MKKIKVLIVDDSAVVRQTLSAIFNMDPEIEVIGVAADPYFAAKKIRKEVPDVITLDIEMPKMDGLTFLKKIMSQHPIPVVIISSLTTKGADTAVRALELGAVDIIAKPNMSTREFIEESRIRITDSVKTASKVKLKRRGYTGVTKPVAKAPTSAPQTESTTIQSQQTTTISSRRERPHISEPIQVQPKLSADVVLPFIKGQSMIKTTEMVVVVGASTGGTEALREFLTALPSDSPGIVIVQHMPEVFTRSFAERLNELCNISVKEAENNDTIIRGRALIAPGNYHTLLKRSGARYYVEINDGPLVNRHRPSVDILFRSAAIYAGSNSLGILMTGMGDDGARGLLELKERGAVTIAQDEKSCVIFGMPKEAIKLGAAQHVLPLNQMAQFVINHKH
ncbi:MAG TPA: chemotaxis response regulator protein-glutamate methylesterase [Salinivirgaceae bacterium]|nr:chemotaxis response regulator protein-glutamate methylesterase [Salinivirgaceae bacterium]HQA75878.1 chemotaxis response regulator protein-glutamate methylesterase [Salinivirgaceae bacterium]